MARPPLLRLRGCGAGEHEPASERAPGERGGAGRAGRRLPELARARRLRVDEPRPCRSGRGPRELYGVCGKGLLRASAARRLGPQPRSSRPLPLGEPRARRLRPAARLSVHGALGRLDALHARHLRRQSLVLVRERHAALRLGGHLVVDACRLLRNRGASGEHRARLLRSGLDVLPVVSRARLQRRVRVAHCQWAPSQHPRDLPLAGSRGAVEHVDAGLRRRRDAHGNRGRGALPADRGERGLPRELVRRRRPS